MKCTISLNRASAASFSVVTLSYRETYGNNHVLGNKEQGKHVTFDSENITCVFTAILKKK